MKEWKKLMLGGLLFGAVGNVLLIFSTQVIVSDAIFFSGMPATTTIINQTLFKTGFILNIIGIVLESFAIWKE